MNQNNNPPDLKNLPQQPKGNDMNNNETGIIGYYPITSKEPVNLDEWVKLKFNDTPYWMPKEVYDYYVNRKSAKTPEANDEQQ